MFWCQTDPNSKTPIEMGHVQTPVTVTLSRLLILSTDRQAGSRELVPVITIKPEVDEKVLLFPGGCPDRIVSSARHQL
jgi:hypothetical protein